MPDESVGVKLTFHVDPRQKRNLLSVGLFRKRTLIISYPVSYTHLRAHETRHDLVCRLLLEKKKNEPHAREGS